MNLWRLPRTDPLRASFARLDPASGARDRWSAASTQTHHALVAGDPGGCRKIAAERLFLSHSAAALISAGSALTAQNLNSGIFPNGSSAGLVSRFAAASA